MLLNLQEYPQKKRTYDFLADENAIDMPDILNIDNYLIVKNNIKYCSGLLDKGLLHY